MSNAKKSLWILIFATMVITLPFIGSDCNSSSNLPGPVTGVSPPQNITLSLITDTTDSHAAAVLNWDASPDENMSDFSGYKVTTYKVNTEGDIISVFQTEMIPYVIHTYTIPYIGRGIRYRTFVTSELKDGTESDSVSTIVYAGIYSGTDGTIDEYQPDDSTVIKSGYGWNTETGTGSNLFYTAENSWSIDMHLRAGTDDSLKFYSPILFPPGTKLTRFRDIGTGQQSFDDINLPEPFEDSVRVISDHVYLIKTNKDYYIKIWVKDVHFVAGAIPPYYNVVFDYKVQPISGLRVL